MQNSIEKVRAAFEEMNATLNFKDHAVQFIESTSWQDFLGRSTEAGLFIAVLWLGLVLITFRNGKKLKPKELYIKPTVSYLVAALIGYGFELLRSSGQYNNECNFALILACSVLGLGIFFNLKHAGTAFKAVRAKRFGYFLRTFELHPRVAEEAAEQVSQAENN